ncbi:unnamed protein product [Durusdinium trenchii]|uniref:Uncharacterized protein n=1 Tax=Durusdinium trenchii TaxID=1381693 RepID=A0ABP0NF80_9DINO
MLRDVPELMTDEPIAEIKWYDAVNDVRNTIASRWLDIIRLRSLVPSSHFQELVDRMRQKIETVVEIHGQELPFCLEPDLELDKVSDKDTPNDPSAATTSEPRNSSSSSTATEQVKMLPHTFKFFQVSAECVWSVVQVDQVQAVDGYRNFFSFAEWWQFKTKYTQWFTKSYSTTCLSLSAWLDVSPGHVMRRTGYKGLKRLAYCLPIDGASAMGILLTVGCILPSNSLGAEAVTACRILLAALERHAKVRKIQVPLADGGKLSLEANDDNEFLLSDLKSLHKKLGLNYARHKCAIEVGGFRVPASHIVMALLRLRTSGSNECINGAFHLLTKSVCHSFAQTAERSIEQKLLSECPDPCVLARVHPFMKRATTRGNKSLQMSLVSRWVSRGGGYVSLKDTNLEKLNIVGKRSTLASRTAAEYTARILVKSAECMEESVEKSKVVNFCFDAARVAEEQVLSVIFRACGKQFAGATQLLPSGLGVDESACAMERFAEAAKVQMGQTAGPVKLPCKSFDWREFRLPTKQLLMAVANALQVSLHNGFSFKSCRPRTLLVPRSHEADRFALLDTEKQALGLGKWPADAKLSFVYHYGTQRRWLDFMPHDDQPYKLIFSADEGTEGFIGYLHLAHCGIWCNFWPDMLHKLARKASTSLVSSGADDVVKKLRRVFQLSRGPWSTSKFGKELEVARMQILRSLKEGTMDHLELLATSNVTPQASALLS